ncbi:hypothetical protein FA13DRAFT_1710106 [Coprinellus micaceus]|uniref:Uncharacterized protein n=1 Tax=Coprinellus micaceus TaxID=71717 RepID=A0A4Y7TA68_COPMI|nr:hypothetical protein FA13DRAFT_1710106 [Coprinellus micaceus]
MAASYTPLLRVNSDTPLGTEARSDLSMLEHREIAHPKIGGQGGVYALPQKCHGEQGSGPRSLEGGHSPVRARPGADEASSRFNVTASGRPVETLWDELIFIMVDTATSVTRILADHCDGSLKLASLCPWVPGLAHPCEYDTHPEWYDFAPPALSVQRTQHHSKTRVIPSTNNDQATYSVVRDIGLGNPSLRLPEVSCQGLAHRSSAAVTSFRGLALAGRIRGLLGLGLHWMGRRAFNFRAHGRGFLSLRGAAIPGALAAYSGAQDLRATGQRGSAKGLNPVHSQRRGNSIIHPLQAFTEASDVELVHSPPPSPSTSSQPVPVSFATMNVANALVHKLLLQVQSGHVRTPTQNPVPWHYDYRVGHLAPYPWPLDPETFRRLTPSRFQEVMRTHELRAPSCLCAILDHTDYSECKIGIAESIISTEHGRSLSVLNGEYVATCASRRCGFFLCLERFYDIRGLRLQRVRRRETPLPVQELDPLIDVPGSFPSEFGLFQVMSQVIIRGPKNATSHPSVPKKDKDAVMANLTTGMPEGTFWATFVQCLVCKDVMFRKTMIAGNHTCAIKPSRIACRHHPYRREGRGRLSSATSSSDSIGTETINSSGYRTADSDRSGDEADDSEAEVEDLCMFMGGSSDLEDLVQFAQAGRATTPDDSDWEPPSVLSLFEVRTSSDGPNQVGTQPQSVAVIAPGSPLNSSSSDTSNDSLDEDWEQVPIFPALSNIRGVRKDDYDLSQVDEDDENTDHASEAQ